MPLITIGWNEAGSRQERRWSSGMADWDQPTVFLAPLDSNTGSVTEKSKEIFLMPLGAGGEFTISEVSVKWLHSSALIFHYQSSHCSVFEKLVTANNDFLKVKDFRMSGPYDDLLL